MWVRCVQTQAVPVPVELGLKGDCAVWSSGSLDWQVLLIGGASGVGKSVAAQALAWRLRISYMLVDDIRLAIQAVTTPAQVPALHTFLVAENPATLSPEASVGGLLWLGFDGTSAPHWQ